MRPSAMNKVWREFGPAILACNGDIKLQRELLNWPNIRQAQKLYLRLTQYAFQEGDDLIKDEQYWRKNALIECQIG